MSDEHRDDDITALLSDADAKELVYNEKYKQEIEKRIINRALWIAEKQKSRCIPKAHIGGLLLTAGDVIQFRVKGFARNELEAVFECYDPIFNWVKVRTKTEEMTIKLSDVRYIRKLLNGVDRTLEGKPNDATKTT
jgi:hypothetical protein